MNPQERNSIVSFYFLLTAVINAFDRVPMGYFKGNLKRKAKMVMDECGGADKSVGNVMFNNSPEIHTLLADSYDELMKEIFGSQDTEPVNPDNILELTALVKAFKAGEVRIED